MSQNCRIIVLGDRAEALQSFRGYQPGSTGTHNWCFFSKPQLAAQHFSRRIADTVIFWGPLGWIHEEFVRQLASMQLMKYLVALFRVRAGEAAAAEWTGAIPVSLTLAEPHGINELYECLFKLLKQSRLQQRNPRVHRRHLESGNIPDRTVLNVLQTYLGRSGQLLLWIRGDEGMGRIVLSGGRVIHAQFLGVQGIVALQLLLRLRQGSWDMQMDPDTVYPQTIAEGHPLNGSEPDRSRDSRPVAPRVDSRVLSV